MMQDAIKDKLINLLAQESPDMSLFLELASEFAKTDQENVRFSVDAGLIDRLGKELVGKPETAVSELIKNAFDADATHADVIFYNALEPGGTLVIDDDGNGMNREDLINGFMRLSSSDKIHNPASPLYRRKRAGKKGIGRFSAQRLGSSLTITTQTAAEDFALKTTINWSSFESDKELIAIASRIEQVPKEKVKGTTLTIENLYDSWSDKLIDRIYRSLSMLLQPESLFQGDSNLKNTEEDPGFTFSICRDSLNNLITNEIVQFKEYALATIEGYVDENGQGYWRVKSSRHNITSTDYTKIGREREDNDTPYKYLRNICFKTYYFIYKDDDTPKTISSLIKKLGNDLGGIKIYRNGFRVPPFGDRGDDWLGLDESVRRKTYLFPHQNQSFFGFVEIPPIAADLFEETSNREGLIITDAFYELREYVYRAIISACGYIASVRGRKTTANQKDWEKKGKDGINQIKAVVDKIEKITEEITNESGDDKNEELKETVSQLSQIIEHHEEETIHLIDENNMLRVVAGLGLTIGEFVHEVKNYIFNLEYALIRLRDKSVDKEIYRVALANIETIVDYLRYFDLSFSDNVVRELHPVSLKQVVNNFMTLTLAERTKAGIELTTNLEDIPFQRFETIPMHPSEWPSILMNLYSNAKKATKKAQPQEGRRMDITIGKENDRLFLEFSDNGTGIDEKIKDRIFDAFFTTTSAPKQNATDQETYTSTGLGLKIIKDIVSSYDGAISVVSPKEGYKTTFRIEIKKNS